jgi:hypothetical protein
MYDPYLEGQIIAFSLIINIIACNMVINKLKIIKILYNFTHFNEETTF